MNVYAQIEEECRQNFSCLKGYSYLKLFCKKMSYQKPRANTVSTARRKTLCRVRSDIKELLFIKLTYFVFVPLLSKQILTKQKKASTKNSQGFLPSQVPVLKRNKATNSNTLLIIHFSAAMKNLLFGYLFMTSSLDLPSHSHGKFATCG